MKSKTKLLSAGMLLAALASSFGQPIITNQPQSQTNIVGSTAVFSVGATGTLRLFYQWQFNSSDLTDRTNTMLVLTNVQTGNAGLYTVLVSNVDGAVTSAVATLTVLVPPAILSFFPTNQSVSLGASATFTALGIGTQPIHYQWRLNDVELPGRTSYLLTLTNIQLSNAGAYSVVLTNFAGSVTSQVAHLDVDPTFTKITTGSIVTDPSDYWNGSWADYDNDGYLDLFVGTWFYDTTNHLYHNNGDGTFTRVAANNMVKIPSNQHGSSWGDYDNDGYPDLMVTAGNPEISHNVIYHNNANGTFTAITNSPIYDETTGYDVGFHGPSWVDYDNDGFLDLFVAGHTPQNHLWRNNGDGSFTKITNSSVVMDSGDSEGRAWADYDNDGYVDLFVCNNEYRNILYRNNGDGTFTKITNSVLTSMVDGSIACAWGDYDNDGFLDVFLANGFTANQQKPNSLYRNNGDGTFTKILEGDIVSVSVNGNGYSSSCAWGDYDNDGYLDLFVTQSSGDEDLTRLIKNQLYHNNGDGTFTRITTGSLANDLGRSHGPSWVDYDNDGFLDLFVANGGFWAQSNHGALLTNFLYHNNGNSNHWITIKLIGTVSNRSAIGAKVRVKATIRGRTTSQVRQIFGGDSQANEQPLDVHFGLGDATNIDLVRIEWPSGAIQELRDVAVKQFLTVTEPPRLNSPWVTNGVFGFTLKGGRGFKYSIQRSSNLLDWVSVGSVTVTNLSGTMIFTDTMDLNAQSRFYRAVSL